MRLTHKINDATTVQVEAETVADLFEKLAEAEQVFGWAEKCGLCGSTKLRHRVMLAQEKYKYYELVCCNPKCGARLTFGQHSTIKGRLFPQLKNQDGSYKPSGGWEKWTGEHPPDGGGQQAASNQPRVIKDPITGKVMDVQSSGTPDCYERWDPRTKRAIPTNSAQIQDDIDRLGIPPEQIHLREPGRKEWLRATEFGFVRHQQPPKGKAG